MLDGANLTATERDALTHLRAHRYLLTYLTAEQLQAPERDNQSLLLPAVVWSARARLPFVWAQHGLTKGMIVIGRLGEVSTRCALALLRTIQLASRSDAALRQCGACFVSFDIPTSRLEGLAEHLLALIDTDKRNGRQWLTRMGHPNTN